MRILLVEDDNGIANFVSRGLRENTYAVDVATDGEDALYQIEINDYDLIILDIMLPVKNGLEVCEEVRLNGNQTPILMLTAKDTVENKVQGLDKGADDYLTKPFVFDELLARIRALLRRPQGQILQPIIKFNNIEIDITSQNVRINGNDVIFTTKEFALLEYLVRNRNRIIGREEISEHVWDSNFDPFTNTIEVYINRLRRKLSSENKSSPIKTKRGAGYILETD